MTQLFLPPTLVYMLIDEQRWRQTDVSSLRYLIYGGAPMSVERLKEAVSVFGPVLTNSMGLPRPHRLQPLSARSRHR